MPKLHGVVRQSDQPEARKALRIWAWLPGGDRALRNSPLIKKLLGPKLPQMVIGMLVA